MASGTLNKKLLGALTLAAALAAFFILRELLGSGSLCYWRNITGFPCPGCGLTSAAFALWRGDVPQSLKFHPFLIPVMALFAVILLRNRVKFFGRLHSGRWFYLIFIALLIGFYIVRLILFFPHGPYPMVYSYRSIMGKAILLLLPSKDT